MSKDFMEQLKDMNNGLDSINKVIINPKNRVFHNRALINRDMQEARIEFFKLGYALRNREIREQTKLKLKVKK